MQEAQSITGYPDQKFITSVLSDVTWHGASLEREGAWIIDSRIVEPGAIFVALSGNTVDGHDFIVDACERGAQACMISRIAWQTREALLRSRLSRIAFIVVPDPHAALLALAAAWRAQFSYPVIGVTGSVGKTTTKELIARILCLSGARVISSIGNYNTLLGLALTMLRMRAEHTHAVFEMGISRRGEMAVLAQFVRPTTAVITAVGHSHMEGLGSLADIASEKRAIFTYLSEQGVGIINGDQVLLSGVAYAHPVIKFGCKMLNQVQARQVRPNGAGIQFILKLYGQQYCVQLPSGNPAGLCHALAAAAVTYYLGVDAPTIIQGLQMPLEVEGRFHKKYIAATHTIIDDSYNANPESMKVALHTFERLEGTGKKIAVLGDMLELGINTQFWHRQIGRFLRKVPSVQHVILVGERMKSAHKTVPCTVQVELCSDWQQAETLMRQHFMQGPCYVLIKASRGVGLHHLVQKLSE